MFTAFLAGLLLLIGLAWLIAAPKFVMDRGTSYEHSAPGRVQLPGLRVGGGGPELQVS